MLTQWYFLKLLLSTVKSRAALPRTVIQTSERVESSGCIPYSGSGLMRMVKRDLIGLIRTRIFKICFSNSLSLFVVAYFF